MRWHLLRAESHCTRNMPGRSNPAHSCPSAGKLQCSRAHTRVHTHVSQGRTYSVCIPWHGCKYKLPAGLRLATEFLLLLVGPGEKQRQNNEGGRVYFFKQPKHGTERFHQQLLSLLCWQPAAGSSLAPALICFSLLLNALLPNIYSPIFFLFTFFLPFFPLSLSTEGLPPTPTHKSKVAHAEGAPRGVKRDVTLNGPRRGEKNLICTHNICMLFSEEEGESERCPKSRQHDACACQDVQAPAPSTKEGGDRFGWEVEKG